MKKGCILGLIAYGGVLAVSACHSAATRMYTLDVAAPGTRLSSYSAPPLRVESLSVPAGWDRIEILQPALSGELKISDFDHWSAALGQVARQALSADLDERLPPGSVIYPRLPKPSGALSVNVDILEFSVVGSRASIQVSWVISPAAAPTAAGAPTPKRSEASLQSPLSTTGPADVARAWSVLLGQLADHIAADAALFADAR
jgi:uncharacterized lipoprotein YmbA